MKKSEGTDYNSWLTKTSELYGKNQTFFSEGNFEAMYDEDFTPEEALLKDRAKGMMIVSLTVNIEHEYGKEKYTFETSEQAKIFFHKFPEIRKELEYRNPTRTPRKQVTKVHRKRY